MADHPFPDNSGPGDKVDSATQPLKAACEIAPDHAEMVLAPIVDNAIPSKLFHTGTVVGLGGSAGSLPALVTFFQNMPPDAGMTFVVVTHLAPGHVSLMAEILQRSTKMRVLQVADTLKVEIDCVYVIPPSKHLFMMNGQIEVVDMENERGRRVAVDLFFRTLGDTHGPHAIGVILSGTDSDGAIGIKRIKERGGLTIVQDPGEAEQEGMPRAAISTGMADWVVPVADIPRRILEYRQNEGAIVLPPEDEPNLNIATTTPEESGKENGEKAFREVLTFLRMRTHRDFSYYKRSTILRRISRRMQVNGLASMEEYLNFVRTHQGEPAMLIQDILISVTNFFRDREAFSVLQELIPSLFAGKGAGDQVRVWVAACATGEEAYSMAMLLLEHADTLNEAPSIQVFATDLDENSLQHARQGRYPETIAADISEDRLRRFFHRESGKLRIRTELRERVLFSVHDLFRDSPFSKLDLISCRNLFIYVNRKTQHRGFDLFHFALNPKGKLFLGSAESAEDVPSLFTPLNKKHRIYVRSNTLRTSPPAITAGPMPAAMPPGSQSVLHKRAATVALGSLQPSPFPSPSGDFPSWRDLHFEFLDGIAPASVLVNSEYEIVHLSEHAGAWLKPASGEPRNDLLEMVNPALRVQLRTALFRATQDGGIIDMPLLSPGPEQGIAGAVRLRVRALPQIPGFYLVAFESAESAAPETVRVYPVEEQWTVRQLEEELNHTRHRLRDVEEQYRASLEELKAGNEELQSMNEELRSAGEELETGREELQSTNEELQTVNHELKGRVEELSGSNSDLQNLMASTNIATIFLDRDLHIKRYTPPAMTLFNFIPSDLGRPLTDLTNRLDFPSFTSHALAVLKDLVPIEEEVKAGEKWFLARMQPYRTLDDRIGGVVLTFVDITVLKAAERALLDSKEHMRLIVENAREYAILSMDAHRVVTSWSNGAERLLGYRESEVVTHSADLIFTPEDRALGAPSAEAETALTKGRAADERWHLRRDGSRFWGSGVMMAMHNEEGDTIGLLKILRDHTEKQKTLEELRRARLEAESATKAKDDFLAMLSHELRTPLSPVLLGIDAMLEEENLSPDHRETLEMLCRNVELEVQLIDDLLDITRICHGKLEISRHPVALHEVIGRAMEVCSTDFTQRKQEVIITLEAVNDRVLGDHRRLQQVFWNMLKNAAKFTSPQGGIWIKTWNDPSSIHVEIGDTGVGLDAEFRDQIFEAMSQGGKSVTRKYGGLGLGLAISKAVVDAHGGEIRAESEGPGKGSVFILSLPLSPGGAPTP